MELKLCAMKLIIDRDELQKLFKRGLELNAETRYDLSKFYCWY